MASQNNMQLNLDIATHDKNTEGVEGLQNHQAPGNSYLRMGAAISARNGPLEGYPVFSFPRTPLSGVITH
jgi:hypothetical protein